MSDPKVQAAHAFINSIRTMSAEDLNALIVRVAGEDLSQFFIDYSAGLIAKEPERVLENTSALMLMGYLLGRQEQHTKQSYDLGEFERSGGLN